MTGKGWATGEDIQSRPYTHIPDEVWNRIFKGKVKGLKLVAPGKYRKTYSENGNRP